MGIINTWLISDPHFDHNNIIKYCNRPFASANEMNNIIINNYNRVVNDNDIVYFLGDMAYGKGSRGAKYWLSQLKGNIIYIKGSHDQGIRPSNTKNCYNSYLLPADYSGYSTISILLSHNPNEFIFDGWHIHGHKHNEAPFFNRNLRKINVSCERINYTPVNLLLLLSLINNNKYIIINNIEDIK